MYNLKDSVEDANTNGVVDGPETGPKNDDSDDMSDMYEI